MTTLADVITLKTQEEWFAFLLAQYQLAGFPVQSWQDGGVELTRLLAMSSGLASLGNYLPANAGGTMLDYAPNFPNWTALTSQQLYNILQNPATLLWASCVRRTRRRELTPSRPARSRSPSV